MLKDRQIQQAVFNSVLVGDRRVLASRHRDDGRVPLVRARLRFPTAPAPVTMPIMIPGVLLGIGLLLTFRRVLGAIFAADRIAATGVFTTRSCC